MFFIKKIKHATNQQWGICEKCKLVPPVGMLCSQCLSNRSGHFHRQVEAIHSSIEWRLRSWLSKILKPQIKFGEGYAKD